MNPPAVQWKCRCGSLVKSVICIFLVSLFFIFHFCIVCAFFFVFIYGCPSLAEECTADPLLKENTFTAPSKQSQAQDSVESLCRCLLHCCDRVLIPTVIVRAGNTLSFTYTHTQTHNRIIIYLILNFCLISRPSLPHNFKQTLEKMILQLAKCYVWEIGHNDCLSQSGSVSSTKWLYE